MTSRIGVNTVHFDLKSISLLGFDCFEVCLGRGMPYEDRLMQVESDMRRAHALGIPMSIHLPVYLPPNHLHDYLDAFFLDNDADKRQSAMDLLELNLEKLKGYPISHMVLHFPGIYPESYTSRSVFEERLEGALEAMDDLARKHGVRILLEYFASNGMFYDPKEWVENIGKYPALGILLDTGHLHFAAKMRGFTFEEAFEILLPVSEAFHLWTAFGDGVYGGNDHYCRYHHIIPDFSQTSKKGWAFDLVPVLTRIKESGRSVIIEASPTYGGTEHFLDRLRTIKDFISGQNDFTGI